MVLSRTLHLPSSLREGIALPGRPILEPGVKGVLQARSALNVQDILLVVGCSSVKARLLTYIKLKHANKYIRFIYLLDQMKCYLEHEDSIIMPDENYALDLQVRITIYFYCPVLNRSSPTLHARVMDIRWCEEKWDCEEGIA